MTERRDAITVTSLLDGSGRVVVQVGAEHRALEHHQVLRLQRSLMDALAQAARLSSHERREEEAA